MPAIRRSPGRARSSPTRASPATAPAVTTVWRRPGCRHPHPGRYAPDPVRGLPLDHQLHDWAGTRINHLAVTALTCQSCHETASTSGCTPVPIPLRPDSRPSATLDANHPKRAIAASAMTRLHSATARCGRRTTFRPVRRARSATRRRATTRPTRSPARTRASAGVLSCHGPTVAATFDIAIVTNTWQSHFDRQPGLQRLGLSQHEERESGWLQARRGEHLESDAHGRRPRHGGGGRRCMTCHESAPYMGMLASTAPRPGIRAHDTLDSMHPTSGELQRLPHDQPAFTTNQSAPPCREAHPDSAPVRAVPHDRGQLRALLFPRTHQGVSGCLSCTRPTVNTNVLTSPWSRRPHHIPIAGLDCQRSGCHNTNNVIRKRTASGSGTGTANISNPTLNARPCDGGGSGCLRDCHGERVHLG